MLSSLSFLNVPGITAWLFLLLAPVCLGQDVLGSFEEIRDALEKGDLVQAYLSVDSCSDATGLLKDRDVSMPLRQWIYYFYPPSGESADDRIEAFDYFVMPVQPDAAMMWVLRRLNIAENGAVSVNISSIGAYDDYPVEEWASFQCEIGNGAQFFSIIPGEPLESLDTYQEMKAAFLAGDDIHGIAYLSECLNAPVDMNIVVGYHSLIFDVIDDGTGNGLILFDDLPILYINPDDYAVYDALTQVISHENGTAFIQMTIWDFDLELLSTVKWECEIGSSLKFAAAQKGSPVVLETYQEIKEAALNGYDIEVSSLLDFCVEPGPAGVIVTAKSTHFELVQGGIDGEDRERLVFHAWGLDAPGALIYSDVLYIYEDDQLFYEAFNGAPGAGPEGLNYFPLMCPLGPGGRVQAIPRERKEPVTSLQEILTATATSGQAYEIVIDFNGCQGGDNYMAGQLVSGVGWQFLLKTTEDDAGKEYQANIFAMITREIGDGLRSPAYDVTSITLRSSLDGSGDQVLVQKGTYDWFTGENVLGQGDGVIECELSSGSVQIYPYL